MKDTLPSIANIRLRFIITYGIYMFIVLMLWIYTRISILYVIPLMLALILVARFNYKANVKVLRKSPIIAKWGFAGHIGVALTDIKDDGKVKIRGETWNACSNEKINAGTKVVVESLKDNLTINVIPFLEENV